MQLMTKHKIQKVASLVIITPVQGMLIHGWFNTRRTVSWVDVVDKQHLDVSKLLQIGLSVQELQHMQPDQNIWVQSGKAHADNVAVLTSWPLHPIDHLKMDIVDFIMQKYPSSVLQELGLTYDYMIDRLGMNFGTLALFGYKWKEWVDLGFTKAHVEFLTHKQISSLFEIPNEANVKVCISIFIMHIY